MKFEVKTISKTEREEEIIFPYYEVLLKKYIKINDKIVPLFGYGLAICAEEDQFNKNFGKELAETRAKINMLKDYKELLIQYTKQPEWRKKKDKKDKKDILKLKKKLKEINDYIICCIDGKLYELKPYKKDKK